MKLQTTAVVPLFTSTLVVAALAPPAPPVRTLPNFWEFNITALEGPGCPDFASPPSSGYSTRPTFGSNTVDGSEIYYWHIAYPHIKASVDGTETHVWCETTLQYSEVDGFPDRKPKADYLFKLHKNGTRIMAAYELDEGVTAEWKFTYFAEDQEEVVDTITLDGPISSGKDVQTLFSSVEEAPERIALPKCGAGVFKYRADLFLSSNKKGAKGIVASESLVNAKGDAEYYGVQQGFSYDWEKCQDVRVGMRKVFGSR